MKAFKLVFLQLFCFALSWAQPEVVDRDTHRFIKFDKNTLYMADSNRMFILFDKLNHLLTVGDKQINIVQIGDSHIQADFFSGRVRQQLQSFFPGGNGGRGFVFPYSVAHTNNPLNYKVRYTGQWASCRNVEYTKTCLLGVAGISVSTYDNEASISVTTSNKFGLPYDYTRVRVMYSDSGNAYSLLLQDSTGREIAPIEAKAGVADWELDFPVREVKILFRKQKESAEPLVVFGMTLETEDPGIVYHAIGVNGAEVISYLRCQLLPKQLNVLQPDLIILSLGTNDAYGNSFDSAAFVANYTRLINRIQERNPETPVILTTPGDCYKNRKYPNRNNLAARAAIYEIARTQGYAVWDFFAVMGGLGSVQRWYARGLTAPDRVHLSRGGYELQGDLMFEALINAYENYTRKRAIK